MNPLAYARRLKSTWVRHASLRRLAIPGQPLRHFCWQASADDGRREPACTFAVGSLRLSALPVDIAAIEEVLVQDEYHTALERLATAGPAPAMVDLGANIGTVSALSLARRPDARITSVEAGPDTFARLAANRAANPGLDWTTVHAAAAGRSGSMQFSCGPLSTGGRVGGSAGVEVPARTLVELLPPGLITLLKVDIEGAEEELLRAGEEQLARVATIVIELHPARCDAEACRAILARCFPTVTTVGGRRSTKPVLLAHR